MPKSFGGARPEDAGAAMHNQWECTFTVLSSQMQSNNVPVRSPWTDFRRYCPCRPRLPSPEAQADAHTPASDLVLRRHETGAPNPIERCLVSTAVTGHDVQKQESGEEGENDRVAPKR